jgi:hypothetical protein
MKRVWKMLLQLYPLAHRQKFAAEIEAVFDQAAEERRARGWRSFAGFGIAELAGLLTGAGTAWTTTSSHAEPLNAEVPNGVTRTQTLIEANLRRMEHAIATHQFEKARFFSHVDRKLRERLNRRQNM